MTLIILFHAQVHEKTLKIQTQDGYHVLLASEFLVDFRLL